MERLEELATRLTGIRALSESIPMVASGSVMPRALAALEAGASAATRSLVAEATGAARTLRRRTPTCWRDLYQANQRLAMLQLRADALFRSHDLFADGLATRADAHHGMLLAGADRLVACALDRSIPGYEPPLAVTYLDSAGRGGAIARARTMLPGRVVLPIAMVRVSPETLPTRLTSLLHEAGHQLNSDLGLLTEGADVIRRAASSRVHDDRSPELWASFTSELLADVWGFLLGGAPSVDGLQRVLSLPGALLYVTRPGDPHPPGVLRVAFGLAFTRRLFPDDVLDRMERRFRDVYHPTPLPAGMREQMDELTRAVPAVVDALCGHRFAGLGHRTLPDVCDRAIVAPAIVRRELRTMLRDTRALLREHPLRALARIGYGRLLDLVTTREHDHLARRWLAGLARTEFARTHGREPKGMLRLEKEAS